jgi:hypothetical protein
LSHSITIGQSVKETRVNDLTVLTHISSDNAFHEIDIKSFPHITEELIQSPSVRKDGSVSVPQSENKID